MKTKKQPLSAYQKTQMRMKQETCRAVAQVKFLENLYKELHEQKQKSKA